MPATLAEWIGAGGGVGIIGAFIYAILGGRLVPRSTVEDIRADKDKQLVELGQVVDLWREAALAKDAAIKEFIPMLTEIIENDRMILKLLGAIKEVVDKPTTGGTA